MQVRVWRRSVVTAQVRMAAQDRMAAQVRVCDGAGGGGGAGVAVQVSWAAGCGLPRRHMRGPRPWCVLTVHLDQSALRSRARGSSLMRFLVCELGERTATRLDCKLTN